MVSDDPRTLRLVINRASELAEKRGIGSVMVGLAAPEGDPLFPDFVAYCRSALRIEDHIVSLTRERTLLHLADVDASAASGIVERLQSEFESEFPARLDAAIDVHFFELTPDEAPTSVRAVLTSVFAPATSDAPPG